MLYNEYLTFKLVKFSNLVYSFLFLRRVAEQMTGSVSPIISIFCNTKGFNKMIRR